MKKYLIFTILCSFLILSGCGLGKKNIEYNYYKDNKSVYRKISSNLINGPLLPEYNKIESADPKNFEVLNKYISKDKNNIYLFDRVLEGIDYDTFSVYGKSNYARDKNNIYFIDWQNLSNSVNIIEADRDSFELVYYEVSDIYSYAKDKNKVFQDEKVLNGVSPDGFELIEGGLYLKDKNAVYGGSLKHKLKGADPKTFKLIEYKIDSEKKIKSLYAKDKNNIYCYNRDYYSPRSFGDGIINLSEENDDSISEADIETFEVTDAQTAKDKHHSYRGCDIIK